MDFENLPAFASAEEMLANPRFSVARDEFVTAILSIYEHNPELTRLLVEAGRGVLFIVIVALHARYDETDRATWPTVRRVVQSTTNQHVSGARRIPALMSRLIETGYLELRLSPRDRRVRILTPTAKMLAQDQDWLVAHYVPLQTLFPTPGYAMILNSDPAFHRAHRLVTADLLPLGARVMAENPVVMQFMAHEAGIMILIKLMQIYDRESLRTPPGVSYSDIGGRFGVSRTQVRKVLEEAEQAGLVHLGKDRSHLVRMTPDLIAAFDRFIAAGMSGHDLIYKLALQKIA